MAIMACVAIAWNSKAIAWQQQDEDSMASDMAWVTMAWQCSMAIALLQVTWQWHGVAWPTEWGL